MKKLLSLLLVVLLAVQSLTLSVGAYFNDDELDWGCAVHTYNDVCDSICNVCDEERIAPHDIPADAPPCRRVCTLCGKDFSTGAHVQQYDCSTNCANCGTLMDASAAHEYRYPCDTHCRICGGLTNESAAHEYRYPCDAHCMVCGELTNESAAHTITRVEAVKATCTTDGNVEYWTCSHCGYCWLDEDLTLVANRMTIVLLRSGHVYDDDADADCNLCGAVRDVTRLAGDVNDDGKRNNKDLLLLMRYLTGWKSVEINLSAADVDGVAGVSLADAVRLQKYLNGFAVELM